MEKSGSVVQVTLSGGSVILPSLVGKPQDEALLIIQQLNLQLAPPIQLIPITDETQFNVVAAQLYKDDNGVQYKVIKEGTGAIPADTSLVKVHYEGRLLNDSIFDSSYKRGEPATFRANQVIKGWTEALTHMPAGSVWEVYIPQDQAYGEREQNIIKPFSTLIFKIELIEVNPKK